MKHIENFPLIFSTNTKEIKKLSINIVLGSAVMTATNEVDFVVICEDLGLEEVTVGSVDTETFVDSATASRQR
jgi:hypothetical protein